MMTRQHIVMVASLRAVMLLLALASRAATSQETDSILVVMLRRIKNKSGFEANAVVDVGANYGDWSRAARKLFPMAKILMVEATPMHDENLKKAVQEIGNAEHRIAVVTARDGETVQFFQGKNTGNSMFRENSKHYADEKSVERQSQTVDSIVAGSFLRDEVIDVIKADVQGAELGVFQGATQVLRQATFVYFEASTVEYNSGAPCTHEVDAFLRSQGFVLYDMAGLNYDKGFKTFGVGQYDVLYFKPDSPRLPKAMRESGAKYCGHRSVLTLPEPTSGALGLGRVDWGTWLTGMACGAVLTLVITRMMQPKYKRMR